MWSMEYEIEQLQEDFAKQMGSIDIKTLTDDFIEEMLLQSKPLQGILAAIRGRQRVYQFLINILLFCEYSILKYQSTYLTVNTKNSIQVKLAEIKKEYDAAIDPLEPLYIQRPPKPAPKPKEEAKPAEPAPAAVEAPAPEPVSA